MATIGLQERGYLSAFIGNGLKGSINGIDQQNDPDRGLSSSDRLEGSDRLRNLVVQQGKVLLLQVCDGCAGFRRDHDIQVNLGCDGAMRRRDLLSESRGNPAQEKEKKQPETISDRHKTPFVRAKATASWNCLAKPPSLSAEDIDAPEG